MLSALIEQVRRSHFPYAPASAASIAQFEATNGWALDPEMREFYLACDGAKLFRDTGAPYRFLPLAEIVRARRAIYGEDLDPWGPPSIYVVCDVQDGDYVGIDVASPVEGLFPVIDCWHESFPADLEIIEPSFGRFLANALESGGRQYWLSRA